MSIENALINIAPERIEIDGVTWLAVIIDLAFFRPVKTYQQFY